ncbi:MAG TPA: 30S ribosomal protein S8e [Candidatus Nanoarchaeia archaeon]|nr:30S ribosomal protein S8e [Candidatus Nanoarchaeia archaeon]
MITSQRSKRTVSGGRYRAYRKKRLYEKANAPTLPKLGAPKKKIVRVFGGNIKQRVLDIDVANVIDPKTKKFSRAKIKTIAENPANTNYVRRNIMTKGTIIETELGRARITNSPGQEGAVNAVLVTK